MPRAAGARVSHHAMTLVLFAALAVAWTWPLVLHLQTALPGHGGDNFSFLWNFWWMRRSIDDPALEFFRTSYLFHPFGTTLVVHTHTALPALIGATLLRPVPLVAAHNVVVLVFVFANMACAYALAFDLTRRVLPSILAGVVYGCSPYLASHLLGHLDLMAAWALPLFAVLFGRAIESGSRASAAGAGLVTVATAYTAYYYVFYIGLLAAVYVMVWLHPVKVATVGPERSGGRRAGIARGFAFVAILMASASAVISVTGGTVLRFGSLTISMLRPQNTLALMWLSGLSAAAVAWMPRFERRRLEPGPQARVLAVVGIVGAIFVIGAAPLIWKTGWLVAHGEYVTQTYVWRSVPLGVDLVSPFLGHPQHPLSGDISRSFYERLGLDVVEAVGWMGVGPLLLLVFLTVSDRQSGGSRTPPLRLWRTVALAFGLVALGPILMVAGTDTGLRLPVILLRYIPFVANARIPGRAMVGVFLALAIMLALRLSSARGPVGRPAFQWMILALVAFEYWDAPIPLTLLERPRVYEALAVEPPGGVCEVPFGLGDGLGTGAGSQDRRALYFATIHQHPLVGGYLARMPADAQLRYERTPVTRVLLALSSGRAVRSDANAFDAQAVASPCRYFVVHRSAGESLRAYVSSLPTELVVEDAEAQLFRIRK